MDSVRICAIALTVLAVTLVLKQWKSDLLPLLRVGAVIFLAIALIGIASPIVTFLRSMTENDAVAEYTGILFKALGIAVLSEVSASVCREGGENGLAAGVEFAGKTEILLLCLPLLTNLLSFARDLLAMGD